MTGLSLSRRARLGLLAALLLGLVAFFPMRLAFGLLGLEQQGISARAVYGSVWYGRIVQLKAGDVAIGTVQAALSPVQLLVGRARLDIWRKADLPDDITGALSAGFNRMGLDDVTGNMPLGAALAPVPVSGINLTDVTVHFSGDLCSHAEGQVKAFITGDFPGLNLSQGLTGAARCEEDALVLPLVSQSGLEKLTLKLKGDGRYVAEMVINTSDPTLGQGLKAAGFAQISGGHMLRIEGHF